MTTVTHAPELNSGILTSWLPLTTTYPVVDGCSSAFYASGDAQANIVYLYNPNEDQVTFATHCLPDVATSWWDQSDTATVTSLGPFVCPGAYTAAFSEVKDESSTLTACCPSGFEFVSLCSEGNVGQCATVLPRGMTLSYYQPDPLTEGNYITTTAVLTASKIAQGVQVNGYNFAGQVVSSTSTTQSTSSSPLTLSQPVSTTPATSTAGATKSGGSLGTGAITGISVGVALSVIGVLSLLAGILYARHQRVKQNYVASPTPSGKKPENAPAEFLEMDGGGFIQEMPGGYVNSKWRAHERAYEMDAT